MSDDGPGTREVAHRVFAAEFDDASLSYSESDEERAPNYVVTPTGARVNRLFVAGVLTEVERVNDETRRGRVVDPSGAFVTYAGQYQPEAQAFLERAEPPSFVALTGKARTFEPEDSDRVFTSVRPESLNEVDADTRDRWVVSAAEATLDRLAVFAAALDSELRGEELRAALEAGGAPLPLAAGIPKAIEHYDTSPAYVEAVRRLAVDALELIAGDRDEVRALDIEPGAGGEATIGALPKTDVTIETPAGAAAPSDATEASGAAGSVAEPSDEATEESIDAEGEASADDEPETAADTEPEAGADAEATVETDIEPTETDTASVESDSGESSETTADVGGSETPTDVGGSETTDPLEGSAVDETRETDDSAGSDITSDVEDPTAAGDSGLGDFETGDDLDDGTAAEPDDSGPATDEMYELDEAEREEIESEFGTDFSTGSEVDDPGEADIDVPDPEELQETPEETTAADLDADPAETTSASDESGEPDAADEPDEAEGDVDLETAVVDAMAELDDGDGADREAVVEYVVDEHGVAASDVEDAIQDALMSGKCYEPGDGVLKPI